MKKNKKLSVFIIDDDFPKPEKFINELLFNKELNKEQLEELTNSKNSKGDQNLLEITSLLINHEYTKKGLLDIYGFLSPEISLFAMKRNLKPDIIIYDWEYGNPYQNSSDWLLKILQIAKNAFIFVYSRLIDQAAPHLNNAIFKAYSKRFQLFKKGEKESSVFSSEEFILQYILTRLTNNNTIKINGVDVQFTSSGYLRKPTDILYLEKILGKNFLISELKKFDYKINKKNLDRIIEDSSGNVLLSANKKFLIDPEQEHLIESFNANEEMSYIEVVQKYGIKKLLEALESGLVKIG